MKHCINCNKEFTDETVICPECGDYMETISTSKTKPKDNLLHKLSERIKTNSIIWVGVAVVQIILGLSGTILPLIVGILNLITAIKGFKYSKAVLENPTGIVRNYEPLTSPIITLIYNLVFGGIIGVAGSIFYLLALRGFVMENKQAFLELEASVPVENA